MLALLATALAAVPTQKLRNGVELPVLAAGTWQFSEAEAEASVSAALDAGFPAIDAAFDYGNQAGVARALQKFPDQAVFVITKIPGCGVDSVRNGTCGEDTAARIDDDLTQLARSKVDLMLVHFPPCLSGDFGSCRASKSSCTAPGYCAAMQAQWAAVTAAYHAGKARSIGVSNYCRACLDCLAQAEVQPMVNQVQVHVGMGPDPEGFVTENTRRGIVLQAYSPMGSVQTGSKDEILSGKTTTALGRKYNKSSVQIALKWLVQHGIPVATKSANAAHLAQDLALFDFELAPEDLAALDALRVGNATPSFFCSDQAVEVVV